MLSTSLYHLYLFRENVLPYIFFFLLSNKNSTAIFHWSQVLFVDTNYFAFLLLLLYISIGVNSASWYHLKYNSHKRSSLDPLCSSRGIEISSFSLILFIFWPALSHVFFFTTVYLFFQFRKFNLNTRLKVGTISYLCISQNSWKIILTRSHD